MKATCILPLAGMLLAASTASAQYVSPVTRQPLGYAPDACGPGFYITCPNGQVIGPNYYLRPPFPPFNGVTPRIVPIQTQGPQGPSWQFQAYPQPQMPQLNQPGMPRGTDYFPYHPYVRSPRDFWMFRENMEEQARMTRPALVP